MGIATTEKNIKIWGKIGGKLVTKNYFAQFSITAIVVTACQLIIHVEHKGVA
jgi:hypothetical protein